MDLKSRALAGILMLLVFISTPAVQPVLADEPNREIVRALFKALPSAETGQDKTSQVKITLGKKLYLDPKLSKSGTISCNSCHRLDNFGVDNEPTSPGHAGARGGRNSPSSFNAALHIAQFWDGRAKDVEEQALGPVLNPVEMGMPSEEAVVSYLKGSAEYRDLFAKAFSEEGEQVTFKNMGRAIGAFERTLITPSRFDSYLNGDDSALSPSEKKGLKTFLDSGCATCHNGVGIGGGMYQKIGLMRPYPTEDLGRFEVTKVDADKFLFKVPSLRNIAQTGPYFHDGSIKKLEDAVKLMGAHQLGRDLSDEQISEIVSFLRSLTGKLAQH